MTDVKLYHIQSSLGHFYVGHLKDQTQAFTGLGVHRLVAVLFNGEGRYLRSLTREYAQEIETALEQSRNRRDNKTQSEGGEGKNWLVLSWEELDRSREELGF